MSQRMRDGLTNGYMECVGTVKRVVKFRERENVNASFKHFLDSRNRNIPFTHRYAWANLKAEMRGLAKYDRAQPVPDAAAFTFAVECMKRHFSGMRGAMKLPFEICFQQLDKTSSCGYPFALRFATKADLLMEQEFEDLLYKEWEQLGTDQLVQFFWSGSVKSEMRENLKVDENSLRGFTASPVDFTLCANRLCLHMNELFYQMGAKGQCWSAVGMSKYNRGWDLLAKRLLAHSFKGIALDGNSFDASVFQKVLWAICEWRIECGNFKGADCTRMRQLYWNIIHSMIITADGHIVFKHTGNPSGSSNTVVDNTLASFIYAAYVWYRSAPEEERTYESFMQAVSAALYGDDFNAHVKETAVSFYNSTSISKYGAEMMIKYTAEDDIWTERGLDELKFLGHGFRLVQRGGPVWVPVPNTLKTLSSLMYGTHRTDIRWHYMRALALYQEAYWNDDVRIIIRDYLHFLDQSYRQYLVDGVVEGIMTWQQVLSMRKSDALIEALYLSPESTSDEACKVDCPHFEEIKLETQSYCMSKIIKQLKRDVQRTEGKAERIAENALSAAKRTARIAVGKKNSPRTLGKIKTITRGPTPRAARVENNVRTTRRTPLNGFAVSKGAGFRAKARTKLTPTQDGCILHKTEMLQQLTGSQSYSNKLTQSLGPTNTSVFKWGSQIAVLFDEFELLSLKVHFITNCGTSTATQQQGQVVMYFIYDSDDAVPADYQSAADYAYSVITPSYRDATCRLRIGETLFKTLFVNHGGPEDLSSPAKLVVATIGQPADNANIGTLWVEYDVRLKIPRANATNLSATRVQATNWFQNTWADMYSTALGVSYENEGWPGYTVSKTGAVQYRMIPKHAGQFHVDMHIFAANVAHTGSATLLHTGTNLVGNYFRYAYSNTTNEKLTNVNGTVWDMTCAGYITDPLTQYIELAINNVADVGQIYGWFRIMYVGTANTNSAMVPSVGVERAERTQIADLSKQVGELTEKLNHLTSRQFETNEGEDELLNECCSSSSSSSSDESLVTENAVVPSKDCSGNSIVKVSPIELAVLEKLRGLKQ